MAAPGPHAQDVAFEARLPELRAGGAVGGVAREANFRGRARARAHSLATATCCAARGLSRGGRALYLGAGAAGRRRRVDNRTVFDVALERLRGGRKAASRSGLVPSGAAGQKSRPRRRDGVRCLIPDSGPHFTN